MLNFPQLCDFSPMCQKSYLNFSQSGEHCDITFHKLFCNLRYVLGLKKIGGQDKYGVCVQFATVQLMS